MPRTSARTWTNLARKVTGKTRLLLINTPHNPTGMVLTAAETRAIADLAIDRDLLVVTDEVYEHLVYDVPHVPLASLPGMRGAHGDDRFAPAARRFGFTGWKVGWVTATPGAGHRCPDGQAVPDLRGQRPAPVRDR